ncbi:MAG: DUF397 domain-containing protein [Pseudonocardiaceae bacterium]
MELTAYRRILAALAQCALGEGQSRELIAHLATELYGGAKGIDMTAPEPDGIIWHTSSYSGGNGDCVEIGWRTSSHSGTGNCVEVATTPDAVLVRDSKDRDGAAITVPATAWHAFLNDLAH